MSCSCGSSSSMQQDAIANCTCDPVYCLKCEELMPYADKYDDPLCAKCEEEERGPEEDLVHGPKAFDTDNPRWWPR